MEKRGYRNALLFLGACLAFVSCSSTPPVIVDASLPVIGEQVDSTAQEILEQAQDLAQDMPENAKVTRIVNKSLTLAEQTKDLNQKIADYNDKVITITKDYNSIWQKAEQLKTELEKLKGQRNVLFLVSVFLVIAIVVFVYLKLSR
jgi:septal ring factor EnvC (AmiA/AmiB activator)